MTHEQVTGEPRVVVDTLIAAVGHRGAA
jgi:hypothetical protein